MATTVPAAQPSQSAPPAAAGGAACDKTRSQSRSTTSWACFRSKESCVSWARWSVRSKSVRAQPRVVQLHSRGSKCLRRCLHVAASEQAATGENHQP